MLYIHNHILSTRKAQSNSDTQGDCVKTLVSVTRTECKDNRLVSEVNIGIFTFSITSNTLILIS